MNAYVPVRVESGSISLAATEETLVAAEAGLLSSCDVWLNVPPAWVSRVTVRLYGRLGAARVLLRQAALAKVPLTTGVDGSKSGLALSIRGRPCDAFEVSCQATAGSGLEDGQIYLQVWNGSTRMDSVGGDAIPEVDASPPLVAAALVARNVETGALSEVTVDGSGRIIMANPFLESATSDAVPDTLALRDDEGATAFSSVRAHDRGPSDAVGVGATLTLRGGEGKGAYAGGDLLLQGGPPGDVDEAPGPVRVSLGSFTGSPAVSANFSIEAGPVGLVARGEAGAEPGQNHVFLGATSSPYAFVVGAEASAATSGIPTQLQLVGQRRTGTGQTGGSVTLVGGEGATKGGSAQLLGGDGVSGGNGHGGDVLVRGGAGVGSGRDGNVSLHQAPSSFNSAERIAFIGDVAAKPTASPSSGAYVWSEGGVLTTRASSSLIEELSSKHVGVSSPEAFRRKYFVKRTSTGSGTPETIVYRFPDSEWPSGSFSGLIVLHYSVLRTSNSGSGLGSRYFTVKRTGGSLDVAAVASPVSYSITIDILKRIVSGEAELYFTFAQTADMHWSFWIEAMSASY